MIYTKRSITIRNTTASIDAPVILYRGDKEVEIIFEIIDSKFKFESSNGNLIDNSHAAYGQMVVACPNGSNTISDVMKCENGLITFVMKTSMMDEMTEVGKYSFHIRLYNDDKTSRITLPPVMGGIEVRESLVIDDNTVDNAMVGYSTIQTYGTEEPAFDESGNYIKTDWQTGDIITASKLNKIEETLDTINNDIPSKTSELTNDSGFLTSVPSEYITETELNEKGYLTEHQDISNKADKSEIPTKTSQLTNDSNYLTNIPSEYITETELNAKGYLTEHQNLSDYAKTADIPTKTSQLTNDSNFLTSIPSEYVTDSELNSKGYSTFNGDYNNLTNKPTIPSISGLASESYVNEYVENAIKDIPKEEVDLSDYAKKTELPTKLSQLANDEGYITSIPSEYVTESELNSKGYLTEHQDISGKADKSEIPTKTSQLTNDSGFLTSIPSEYITETELNEKGYSTFNGDYNNLTNKPTIPTKTSQLNNDSGFLTNIPSEYVTETELNEKGYLTEHQDLSDYAKTVDIPTKTSDLTNDSNYLTSIPSEYITETELNEKGYLTEHQDISNKADKSEIPTKTSQLTNDSGFLTSVPSEYVTDSELNAKGYATQTFVQSEIAKVEGELDNKVDNFYGTNNVGKILMVGEDGYLVMADAPGGTGEASYPVVGTVDDDNVITLSSDKLVDGLYTLRYSDGVEYKLIGTVLVGERIATSITATKGKTTYEIGETLTTNDIVVTAHFNDLTSEVVTGYTVDSSSVNTNAEGNYTIIITYESCTTSIPIAVMDMSVTGNLFVASTCTIGKRISSSGEIKDQANSFVTDYIDIGKVMSSGGTNTIHWQGFHLYKVTTDEYTAAGVADATLGNVYRGVAYYDDSNNYLGQDSLYVTAKAYDSEGNYQLTLNNTYSTATKIRIWAATLPPATSVNDLQNCKLTLNQLISEI